jgi:hypothetical protein
MEFPHPAGTGSPDGRGRTRRRGSSRPAARLDQRRAELEEDIERYASDPEAVMDGLGCSVRDLDAYEAAMDAAVDDPEPELG